MDKAKSLYSACTRQFDDRPYARCVLTSLSLLMVLVIDPAFIAAVQQHNPLGTDPSSHSDVFAHAVENITKGLRDEPPMYWTWTTVMYLLNMWLWFWQLLRREKTSQLAMQMFVMSLLSMFTNSMSPGVLPEHTVQLEPYGVSAIGATVITATHTTLSPRFALLCILWRSEFSIGKHSILVAVHAGVSVLFLLFTQQATVAVMVASLLMSVAVSGRSQLPRRMSKRRMQAALEKATLVSSEPFALGVSDADSDTDSDSGGHVDLCNIDAESTEFSAPIQIQLTRVLTDAPSVEARDHDMSSYTPPTDTAMQLRPATPDLSSISVSVDVPTLQLAPLALGGDVTE
ncbi:MAG: hypothetical protein JKX97_00480 [Candidatus Lindowbacteria bacterium]|nr:hypothetical protein [Candidatus Lindowbacteria bacterium]